MLNFKLKTITFFFKFSYELDNGKIFQGRTYKLNFPYLHVYMMLGADDTIYWVEFSTKDEILSDEPFSETVRLGMFFMLKTTQILKRIRTKIEIFILIFILTFTH